jgi:transposase
LISGRRPASLSRWLIRNG